MPESHRTRRHETAPYAEALKKAAQLLTARANVPGHLADPSSGISQYFGPTLTSLDIPPLTDGLDAPKGNSPLDEARKLAADAWGANTTWFITGGASQGNLTTCLALRHLGPRIAVARTMHSSVADGLALAGTTPVTMIPKIDPRRGIAHPVSADTLHQTLNACPDASAAWIVSPSYFGAVADIAALAEVAHHHRVPLVVDEAWGAHFGFHPRLPVNAARLGADLVVSSTHKLGGSLGQSAMIHLGHGPWADQLREHVERALRTTASTSESSILLASLDLARRDLMTRPDAISDTIKAFDDLREKIRSGTPLTVVADEFEADPDVHGVDPLRLTVDVSATGLSGHQVRNKLFHESGIYAEMSTSSVVVFLAAAGSFVDVDTIFSALKFLPMSPGTQPELPELPPPPARVQEMREATFSRYEIVTRDNAIGRVSADSLAAYPPGIPNVLPGELITAEIVDYLAEVAASPHGYVRGAADPAANTFRVVSKEDT